MRVCAFDDTRFVPGDLTAPAGEPFQIEFDNQDEGVSHNVAVPAAMLSSSGRHYALEVKGDSMIEAGINNGDIVVIQEQATAQNGDIVVALIEGEEATLKTFRRRGTTIALEAANPAYETRRYQDHQVKVQGRLVGLIRTY